MVSGAGRRDGPGASASSHPSWGGLLSLPTPARAKGGGRRRRRGREGAAGSGDRPRLPLWARAGSSTCWRGSGPQKCPPPHTHTHLRRRRSLPATKAGCSRVRGGGRVGFRPGRGASSPGSFSPFIGRFWKLSPSWRTLASRIRRVCACLNWLICVN